MSYDIFLMPMLISFATSTTLLIFLVLFSSKKFFLDLRKGNRHSHKLGISRFGGGALIVGFLVAIFFDKRLVIDVPLLGVAIASLAILFFGLVDDVKQLSWKEQLFFQVSIVLFLYIMGIKLQYVTNPFGGIFLLDGFFLQGVSLFFSIAWIIFLINSMNWIDGVDGASSGVALIGGVTIFILSLRPEINQPPIGIITASFLGALCAFLFFNFYPAKILAGTSGSMFMGFILAIMAIFAGAKIATTLLVLTIPIFDAFWVMAKRLTSGDSVFLPDKRHLHFRLIEMGWSVRKICFFYYAVTILVAIIALNTYAMGKSLAFFVVAVVMIILYRWISKKTTFNT